MTETLRSCRSRHPLYLRPGRGYVDPHCDDGHYGLAAFVWTHDISSGLRAALVIESGWVQVNQGGGRAPGHSDGGYKQSGIGREFSLEALLESFSQRKNVTVNPQHAAAGGVAKLAQP